MKVTLRPRLLFHWAGSKARLMVRLIPLMPHHSRYVSVFGGSGADIIFKPMSKVELFNDINADVVNAFRVLRSDEQRRTLIAHLTLTPYSRLQFADCLALLHSDEDDSVKRAWAFLYCTMTQCAHLDPDICRQGSFGVPKTHGIRADWHKIGERIESVGRRFRHVVVENLTWEELVGRYDGTDTFFYCDPPYVLSTRTGRYYKHEMTDEQHAQLLDGLRTVKGCVMLSGYDNDLYRERLENWRRVEFQVLCSMSSAKKKPVRTEVVWLNYDTDGRRLAG